MDKPKLLFVDDRSKRIHSALKKYGAEYDVRIAPNVKEALRLMSTDDWDVVSLDHDLNGDDFQNPEDKTSGMEIVRWIERFGWPHKSKPMFIIHTSNLFVANEMKSRLQDCGQQVHSERFIYE